MIRWVGSNDDSSEGSNDPADAVYREREFLQQMEEADRLARQEGSDGDSGTELGTIVGGRKILNYTNFLQNQKYYDDLKHIDYNFIYYDSGVLIEQDKSLGKGGLCWDAAFVLADYLVTALCETATISAIELGSGTGVCGLMVAANCRSGCIEEMHLTDLPLLLPLLTRNTDRLLYGWEDDHIVDASLNRCEVPGCRDVRPWVLNWEDVDQNAQTYDIIFGADVVATLYDPVALVNTIVCLCHASSMVFISFKERLSQIHRQFETEMSRHFESLEILENYPDGSRLSRNLNPDIKILVAKEKLSHPTSPRPSTLENPIQSR